MTDKIVLAMISRDCADPSPVLRFLENARAHDHTIDRVIVAHMEDPQKASIERIRQKTRLDTVMANNDATLRDQLREIGMNEDSIDNLLVNPCFPSPDLVPYGAYRTAVMIKALLEGMDHVLFFDDDIHPKVLVSLEHGDPSWAEIDFVGRHLVWLSKPKVVASTSDYSGYYIIPPMSFPGLEQLLMGVGKEHAIEYLENCESHQCVFLGSPTAKYSFETHKLLGGNLGLDLSDPHSLSPFFSTTFEYAGQCYLGRGEDTLLGHAISSAGNTAMDIDMRVFHDTFGDFPRRPSIHDQAVRSRFFLACMGWIGRNPFLFWYRNKHALTEEPFEQTMSRQRRGLQAGGKLAAEHLRDGRFRELADAFEASLTALPEVIDRYERLLDGWSNMVELLGRSPLAEKDDLVDDQFAMAS
jgi:hypothetical protein